MNDKHINGTLSNNNSVFGGSKSEVKSILQSSSVVNAPVKSLGNGQFVRVADTGKVIGTTSLKNGGVPTTKIKVITDKAGNLVTAYPVR